MLGLVPAVSAAYDAACCSRIALHLAKASLVNASDSSTGGSAKDMHCKRVPVPSEACHLIVPSQMSCCAPADAWKGLRSSSLFNLDDLQDKHCDCHSAGKKVAPKLTKVSGVNMLGALVTRWNNHKMMVRLLSRIFNYLDRYYVTRHQVQSLKDVGLIRFRDLVYVEMKANVKDAVVALIDKERDGELIDRKLLREVLEIFVEIGMGEF